MVHLDILKKELAWIQKNERDLLCFYINYENFVGSSPQALQLIDNNNQGRESMKAQMKIWRKSILNKQLECLDCNNFTAKLEDGTEVYCIVLQKKPLDTNPLDSLSLLLSPAFVNGISYWFYNKTNRDIIFDYINKPKSNDNTKK